jgi:flagellar motor protein MotB
VAVRGIGAAIVAVSGNRQLIFGFTIDFSFETTNEFPNNFGLSSVFLLAIKL